MNLDNEKFSDDDEEKKAAAPVQLLTPVAKAYLTDTGFESCVKGQSVFGGHGYIREWSMEQAVRDARIAQIYEGTNAIQAMDLAGRKAQLGDANKNTATILGLRNDFMGAL